MSEVIAQALQEYKPGEAGNPFVSWAGECGLFVNVVCDIADANGMPYEIGNAYGGALEGVFELTPPPGLSTDDLYSLGIVGALDHIWVIHDGRHYDGSAIAGVNDFRDLRIVRQVAVDLMRRADAPRLQRLCAEHEYWRDSATQLDEYLAVLAARQLAPARADPANKATNTGPVS